jgi:SAM-dependent methyltransferase
MTEDWRHLNRANWDERTALHIGPRGYDLSSHRAGNGSLDAIVEAELGAVRDLRVLHLQSHVGHDTIAIAQRGAREIVGVDFSPASLAAARALAAECKVANVRFVESDVLEAARNLPELGSFDLAFTTWGTITWLPDLSAWARTIAHFLKPGGAFYFADAHPSALVFDDMGGATDAQGRPGWFTPYFERGALSIDDKIDYADTVTPLSASQTIQWMHPLADIVGALRDAGLRLDWLHEHPRLTWRLFPSLVHDADGLWTWPDRQWLPLALSLRAIKEA